MAGTSGEPRRLELASVLLWDDSPDTYASCYLVMAIGFFCAAWTWFAWKGPRGSGWEICTQSTLMAALTGVAFGSAGLAFQLRAGKYMIGTSFAESDAQWLFPWGLSVIMMSVCSASAICVALAFNEQSETQFQVAHVLGVMVAVFVSCLILDGKVKYTPALTVYWGLSACVLACGTMLLQGSQKPPGDWWIFLGLLMRGCGYLYILLVPCSEEQLYSVEGFCSYPVQGNHNAIFNTVIALSMVPIAFGVVRKRTRDLTYGELLGAEAKDNEAKQKSLEAVAPDNDLEMRGRLMCLLPLIVNTAE
eukprot:CAMPEP_0183441342 /NCGR_PEP_ID=MMETSP0370-20130417/84436_1 /TAXON_ID=268820 /ORGANISM="Peridinium aciculiferum, Strain PAER-2" /LENGTH=304 /DNA_ID=CAMNT_0025630503 /DNA_START=60 /DNA_END=975 /DNA_ORIENTATION=-